MRIRTHLPVLLLAALTVQNACGATITTQGGKTMQLDEINGIAETAPPRLFSFIYGGQRSDDALDTWPHERGTTKLTTPNRTQPQRG